MTYLEPLRVRSTSALTLLLTMAACTPPATDEVSFDVLEATIPEMQAAICL